MTHTSSHTVASLLLGLCLATGIASAGFFISETMVKSKVGINTAQVKGLAERVVRSDTASWSVEFAITEGEDANPQALYARSEAFQNNIISTLSQNGFSEEEIQRGVLNYSIEEIRDPQEQLVQTKRVMKGTVQVMTAKVESIGTARMAVSKLLEDGVVIMNNEPIFRFTNINAIKPEMLKEATQNARLAANEFASNAGVQVGRIQNATQGGFVVVDEGEDYSDNRKINKVVRVVTTIRFYLTE